MKSISAIILVLSLSPGFAQAETRAEVCAKLGRTEGQRAHCTQLAATYELSRNFIKGCANFSDSDEVRMDCLKSGSTEENLRLCQSLDWSESNTITCLRYMQNPVLARHCKNFSEKEESQVDCLRFGREISQVDSCRHFSTVESEKLDCLKQEIPSMRITACKKNDDKMGCLKDYVASVEREYKRQRDKEKKVRKLASEKQPIELTPEPKRPLP